MTKSMLVRFSLLVNDGALRTMSRCRILACENRLKWAGDSGRLLPPLGDFSHARNPIQIALHALARNRPIGALISTLRCFAGGESVANRQTHSRT